MQRRIINVHVIIIERTFLHSFTTRRVSGSAISSLMLVNSAISMKAAAHRKTNTCTHTSMA
jgi:hypothetical protein